VVSDALLDCAITVDKETNGVGDAYAIGHFHQSPLTQPILDKGLSHPPGSIGSRPVHLSRVLARKGSSSMSTPPSISIHYDLASSESCIPCRPTDHKLVTRVDVVDSLII
jgi:hypothetical protein